MLLERRKAHRDLMSRRHFHQTDDSAMGVSLADCQLPKVLVEGDQYPLIHDSALKQRFIVPGDWGPAANPIDVMPLLAEGFNKLPGNTGIQQQPHAWGGRTRSSTRSPPTTRPAYARQARISSGSSQG